MRQITKEESMALRAKYPELPIVITSRQGGAKRKKYYTEDTARVMHFIDRLHGREVKNANGGRRENGRRNFKNR